jgi:transcriptional regulator with XRE-family HTH domain
VPLLVTKRPNLLDVGCPDPVSHSAAPQLMARFKPLDSTQRDRPFDQAGFFSALDAVRESRGCTWKQLADNAGVSQSTLSRMGQGKRPDVDSFVALLRWSNLEAEDFVINDGPEKGPEPLAEISILLRRDPNLTPEAASALDELVKATYHRLRK